MSNPSSDLTTSDLESLFRNNTAHPNPMFDFLTGFVPRRLRDLFVWMEYLYYNSAQIFAALKKFSEYPITDIAYTTTNSALEKRVKDLHAKQLKVKSLLIRCGLDRWIYGNSFTSVYQPFVRFLKCPECGKMTNIEHVNYRFKIKKIAFEYTCRKCKNVVNGKVIDRRLTNPDKIHIIRWDPKQMDIDYNPITGESVYYYSVSKDIKDKILKGNKHLLNTMPMSFLKAVETNKMYRFAKGQIYHMKVDPPAGIDQQWGFPPLTAAIKLFFYAAVLRKANEAIALDHIVPFRILHPAQSVSSGDPIQQISLNTLFEEVRSGLRRWRRDPLTIMTAPVPVGMTQIGGDGRALLTLGEVKEAEDGIIASLGIPREFIYGGLSFCMRPDAHVMTDRGLLSLNEMIPEHVGVGEFTAATTTREGVRRIQTTHRVSKKQAYRLRVRSGRQLHPAGEHRFWTLRDDLTQDWIRAKDLRPGDHIAKLLGAETWPTQASPLPKPENTAGRIPIQLATDVVTPEVARWFGYMVAEGTVVSDKLEFCNANPQIIEDFLNCCDAFFAWRPTVQTRHGGGAYTENVFYVVDMGRRNLVQYVNALGLQGYSHEKEIPRIIRQAPREVVLEFIRAYTEGDGCIEDKPRKQALSLHSKSQRLLQQVQLLLQNVGIDSTLYPAYRTRVTYLLQIRGAYIDVYAREIGFVSDTKNETLHRRTPTDSRRTLQARLPFLKQTLRDFRDRHFEGRTHWIANHTQPALPNQTWFSVQETAEVLGRDVTTVRGYVRQQKLQATYHEGTEGRFGYYLIHREALCAFVKEHGIGRRVKTTCAQWELNRNKFIAHDLAFMEEKEPILAARVHKLVDSPFVWDEIIEIQATPNIIEMGDLTIDGTPEYSAEGLVSHNTGSAITLRMLENQLLTYTGELNELLQWVTDRCCKILGWQSVESELTEFKLIDDVQQKQLLLTLNQGGQQLISNTTIGELNDFDLKEERTKRKQEQLDEVRFQHEMQTEVSKLQNSLAQQVQNQALMGQQGLAYDQQQVISQADQLVQQLMGMDYGGRKSFLHSLQVEDFVMYSVVVQRLEEAQTQGKRQQQQGG